MKKYPEVVISHSCCNCGDDVYLEQSGLICQDCGGFACDNDCLNEHECDPDGDM